MKQIYTKGDIIDVNLGSPPSDVKGHEQDTAGLTADSYALCHQIRTVSFARIVGKRSRLESRDILKIHSVLIDTLEL